MQRKKKVRESSDEEMDSNREKCCSLFSRCYRAPLCSRWFSSTREQMTSS